jgi:hypothetical protein
VTHLDPEPGIPYATCECGVELATKGDCTAHLSATMHDGASHIARVRNPPREDRIRRILQTEVNDLVYEVADKAWTLVDDYGATEVEIAAAMRGLTADFTKAWRESRP